ncbi:MAG TPA: CPBP family intramembrane glutamic endopeptidase [Candidatus Acidoferrales bacterium]|nr:CPBP family intramembrane glutamic endopeptidase [Candidatus Acidoferrales bacterium]
MFIGPNGIRAGWRILIFCLLTAGILVFVSGIVALIPPVRNALLTLQVKGPITPGTLIAGEGGGALVVLLAAALMTRIEKRSFSDYGLPLNQSFAKLVTLGLVTGFLSLTLLIGLIAGRHGYSVGGIALVSHDAIKYGLLYAIAFLLVGMFEEFTFRGYLQYTLGSGIGFWPAAFILAILFGAAHLTNPGEARFGALMAGTFGLVAVFSLRRTGSLWFAIAMHAAWDWGETFFYSVPDSGVMARGHLLDAAFHGPRWLTGGSVGPEGSILVFPVLVIWALAIHWMFPARRTAA